MARSPRASPRRSPVPTSGSSSWNVDETDRRDPRARPAAGRVRGPSAFAGAAVAGDAPAGVASAQPLAPRARRLAAALPLRGHTGRGGGGAGAEVGARAARPAGARAPAGDRAARG